MKAAVKEIHRITAEDSSKWWGYFGELRNYRDLFLTFVERDLKVRYRQTALGIIWVILQPLVLAGAFTLILGRLTAMPSGPLPYLTFYLAALVPWNSFAWGVSSASTSLEASAQLLSKVYFPRIVVPAAHVFGAAVDFLIGFIFLQAVALWQGHWTPWLPAAALLLLPLQVVFMTGLGVFFAALNAQYRDVKYVIPFVTQVGMLATPVIYPLEVLPQWGLRLMGLNPMATVIEGYRWALGGAPVPAWLIMANAFVAVTTLIVGVWFLRRREARLMDVL